MDDEKVVRLISELYDETQKQEAESLGVDVEEWNLDESSSSSWVGYCSPTGGRFSPSGIIEQKRFMRFGGTTRDGYKWPAWAAGKYRLWLNKRLEPSSYFCEASGHIRIVFAPVAYMFAQAIQV